MNDNKTAVVSIKSGKLEGSVENGLYAFKGIPYAAPPLGELRWMPPQPVKPWQGVRAAKEFGTIAPQNLMPIGPIPQNNQPQSEDCLFLNVWTPGLDKARRPVMVWIHGGAFSIGSGSDVMFAPQNLAKKGDVVSVSINYRLGMLGFLRLKDVTGGKIPATGNEGFLDQVAALKWVKENIAAFGGDPGNVTVFGESAGSMSIACLMVMPSAKGLFHKAIMESGVGSIAVPRDDANKGGDLFLKASGIKKDDAAAMRALTVAQLLALENKMKTQGAGPGEAARVTATTPVTDGEVIPDLPIKLARQGVGKEIKTIIGTNLDEGTLFTMMIPGFDKTTEEEMMKRIAWMIPQEGAAKVAETYRKHIQKRGMPATPAAIVTAIQTDIMFRVPSLELASALRDNGAKVYDYLFDWVSPAMGGAMGACHGLEVGFVFGTHDPMFCGAGPEADKLSNAIQESWLNFAHTGDPSGKGLGNWPAYGSKRETMIIGKKPHVENAPHEEERAVWEKVKKHDSLVI
jgi:para-nitrobenzyl esterase